MTNTHSEFHKGVLAGLPIALGYFSVSFTFGIFAVREGFSPLLATLLSLTNLSSAGQFAGVRIMADLGSYAELAVAVLLINLRYLLMSLALASRLDPRLTTPQRLLIGFGVTDEIYAVASQAEVPLGSRFFYGLMSLPVLSWVGGTFLGAALGPVLPSSLASALGIALYCMFIAIIVPPARADRRVLSVVVLAIALNLGFLLLPGLRDLAFGWRITIVTVLAAGCGALLWPKESTS